MSTKRAAISTNQQGLVKAEVNCIYYINTIKIKRLGYHLRPEENNVSL